MFSRLELRTYPKGSLPVRSLFTRSLTPLPCVFRISQCIFYCYHRYYRYLSTIIINDFAKKSMSRYFYYRSKVWRDFVVFGWIRKVILICSEIWILRPWSSWTAKARFTHSRFERGSAAIWGGDQSPPRIGSSRVRMGGGRSNRKCEPGLIVIKNQWTREPDSQHPNWKPPREKKKIKTKTGWY